MSMQRFGLKALTLLLGLTSPDSPVGLIDADTIHYIMALLPGRYHSRRDPATGQLQSVDDEPAVVFSDGSAFWYDKGLLHRDGDRPATIWADGRMMWFIHGVAIKTFNPMDEA